MEKMIKDNKREDMENRTELGAGTIYLVATPIGNLGDISLRALEILKAVDIIACEDTRNSIKLMNHFGIRAKLTSYHEHNKIDKAYVLVNEAKAGKSIAMISDAGMPAISDPGEELVRIAIEEGVSVSVVPGASACISALALSGFSTRRFCFEGFLPYDKKDRRHILENLQTKTETLILYEAPHKLLKTLNDLKESLGEDRRIALVRELTKKHEEVLRLSLGEAIDYYTGDETKLRGEYVLVIEGRDEKAVMEEKKQEFALLSIEEHMKFYESQGLSNKEAMKAVAKDRGISKREVYAFLVKS